MNKNKIKTENNNRVDQDTVKIAGIFAKTGEAGDLETMFFRDLHLSVDVLNRKGGFLGKPIKLIEYDTQSTSIGAKIAADKAVKDKVIAAIGASWSSHSMAAAAVFQKAGIVMITPDSTNPKVTQIGDYIFRTCIIDTDQGRAAAHFVKKDLNFKNAVILVNINDEYSIGLSEIFKKEFELINGNVLFYGEYTHQSTDFKDILLKIKTLKPEIIYLPGRTADIKLIILQSLKMGIKTTFIGGDSWDNNKISDFCRENDFKYYFTGNYENPNIKDLEGYNFVKEFQSKFNSKGTGYIQTYDTIIVLDKAINKAQSLNPEDIKKAIFNTKIFSAYQGELAFNEQGDPLGLPIAVYTVNDSGKEVYKVLYY